MVEKVDDFEFENKSLSSPFSCQFKEQIMKSPQRHCDTVEANINKLCDDLKMEQDINNNTKVNENTYLRQQLGVLRRDFNKVVLEDAYLRSEKECFENRWKEEVTTRKRLQDELKALVNTVDAETAERSIPTNSENTNLLLEQLNACKDDYYEERKEKEQYKLRNIYLDHQLDISKTLLEQQEKKLLLYANIFKNPIISEIKLPLLEKMKHSNKYLKSINREDKPGNVENGNINDNPIPKVNKHCYDERHIIEASFSSKNENPDIKREKSSSTNFTLYKTKPLSRRFSCPIQPLKDFDDSSSNSMAKGNLSPRSPAERKRTNELRLHCPISSDKIPVYSPIDTRSPERLPLHSPALSSVSSAFNFSNYLEAEPSSNSPSAAYWDNNNNTLYYPPSYR